MPIYTVPKRSNINGLGDSSQKQPAEITCSRNRFGQQFTLCVSEKESSNPLSQSLSKARDLNRTYVVSACTKLSNASPVTTTEHKLTLQRRTVTKEEKSNESIGYASENTQTERRLTLQRRTRIGSTETHKANSIYDARGENAVSVPQKSTKSTLPPVTNSSGLPLVMSGLESRKDSRNGKINPDVKIGSDFKRGGSNGPGNYTTMKQRMTLADSQSQIQVSRSSLLTTAEPSDRASDVTRKHNFGKENGSKTMSRSFLKNENLEGQKTPRKGIAQGIEFTPKYGPVKYARNSTVPMVKNKTLCLQTVPQKSTSILNAFTLSSKKEGVQENSMSVQQTVMPKEDTRRQNKCTKDDAFKIENSKVTVAVRVRPFSIRDKNEGTFQVVSMTGQETVVQHPDTKQIYRFTFDFSFWSFDQSHSFASQEMVYQSLAVPLLERAFEGYNTCLFAYGQTGSGKSYTMMGFDDDHERGIIPRFCEDIFTRIAKADTQQTAYHLEMSYFEVYNEKIHDLLILKAENGQKKQPLRVREHPVFGPYVEDLTVNIVSSYTEIQNWLQLGNKHRATAATGMNDKSSRSHSVFTLVMTQTKTDIVEKEEHEYRIISRVNLIDLAGSERCSAAQTSGERLKEGVSINKSLLTLGKVISALSEQNQSRKKVFIPYRESVLTWLLKESLGGNSKTAMIATISPAASNVEETLSTLRYAKQACFIINVAKVNEDINAKLILELKAEIEKLKLAQKNMQNVDPEKQRLYVQEITSLRMKLHQQEREMAEMQRAWKEKLEQAEKKKFEETVELQKAGITFKVDNSLPNLVNLNEDPQLSEMLLYMIKEGETTVGKCKPHSRHDIQLSGVLIADDHCIIRHVEGAVCTIPVGEAKTYVNGKCISGPTFLHHGDRIILGGDHYFRFNHPVEVQKVKSRYCGASLPEDGPKDFEFAKNELLAAQKAQLESEIEEARLKAKEEMMQSMQIAKEMAQEELSSQQKNYENQIKLLETQLEEESRRTQLQEMNNQMAANRIQELEKAKQGLELEVHFNKKRLKMETLAAREVLEDHAIRRAKILEALEAEKQKIAQEVQILQQSRGKRTKAEPNWNSLKLSMMIKEANTISSKLEKHTVFCRHDAMDQENGTGPSLQVQVRNIRLGVATFWSLEKFEDKLAMMKEAYEANSINKADEIFYDPTDEWEPDVSNTSVSSLSTRRRSRSLRKSKRISGCLSEVKMRLNNSYLPGSANTLGSLKLDPPESFLPGICKELIGSALDVLGQTHEEEESMARSLLTALCTIYTGVTALTKAYEQAEESHENFFIVDQVAQSSSIRITTSFEQLVVLTKHWLNCFRKNDEFVKIYDELRDDIKHLGGYLQLLLQGGCSDLSSVVAEAQRKIMQMLKQMVNHIGHLAALTGLELHFTAESKGDAKKQFLQDICEGIESGLEHLLDSVQITSRVMQDEISKWYPQNEVQNQIKNKATALAKVIENIVSTCKKKKVANLLRRGESIDQELKKATCTAAEFLDFHHCLEQVHQIVTSSLQGAYRHRSPLRYFIEKICILAGNINALCYPSASSMDPADNPAHKNPELLGNQSELDAVAKSLVISFEIDQGDNALKFQDGCMQNTHSEGTQSERGKTSHSEKQKGVLQWEYQLLSLPENLGESSPCGIHWV
ncbi:kinesin-like protein KIF14 [Varanus komodoensis]|uniref:kinesin-like protein KIF14 n=1 Tax=Varanus komodoensis TaxID=61221 RepID=UPI001CF7C6F7|nr:kinesin-like protein KIF14 [Varanus komodoensis]